MVDPSFGPVGEDSCRHYGGGRSPRRWVIYANDDDDDAGDVIEYDMQDDGSRVLDLSIRSVEDQVFPAART